MIYDFTKDFLQHVHSLGLFPIAKVYNDDDSTRVETTTDDKSVMVYGKYKDRITEFNEVAGFGRMQVLQGFANFQPFSGPKAKVVINKKKTPDGDIPEEIAFDSGIGHKSTYRLMSAIALSELNVPVFKGAKWDVTIVPTKQGISELKSLSAIMGGYVDTFSVLTEDGKLMFSIGKGASDKTYFPFAETTETLATEREYSLKDFLALLKLVDTEDTKICFTERGAIMIEVTSELSTYQYIMRAQTR